MASPSEVARLVVDLAMGRPATLGDGRLVCLDGPAGSGKTTLAAEVARLVAGAHVVHMDDLYAGWSGIDHAVTEQLDSILLPLAEGRPGRFRRFDWIADEFAEEHLVEPCPLLVLEGVGSGTRAHAGLCTVLVWVDAPRDLRMTRGIERDGEAFRVQWEAWAESEQVVFAREGTQARADVRVDGTGAAPPSVIA
jgi:uridine kinase